MAWCAYRVLTREEECPLVVVTPYKDDVLLGILLDLLVGHVVSVGMVAEVVVESLEITIVIIVSSNSKRHLLEAW